MPDSVVLVAQATSSSAAPADAVQNGTVVSEAASSAPASAATGEVHATTAHADAPLGFPPFDASSFASQTLWFVLTFVVLYVVMSRVALPQIGSIIDTRKARIAGDLKEAARLKGETDRAISAYETALAEARINSNTQDALSRGGEIAADTAAALVSQLTGEANPADVQAAVAQAVKEYAMAFEFDAAVWAPVALL